RPGDLLSRLRRRPGIVRHRSLRAALPARGNGRARLPHGAGRRDRRVREGGRMRALIALLPGDGIGPEVTAQAARVITAVGELYGHSFALREAPVGGIAIDQTGDPLPAETIALCQAADAVLLGAVGGPRWGPSAPVRPEQGLLGLRRALAVFANLRPAMPHPRVAAASPLKPALLRGVDVLVVRELTGGIYFGEKRREADWAEDLCTYSADEIARVVRVAARLAQTRSGRLNSVDKANVMETSRLWSDVAAPGCTSLSTARPRTSPARASPTPTERSAASRCCCATRCGWTPKRARSKRRSRPRWNPGRSPPTWPGPKSAPPAPQRWATPSS